MTANRLFQSDFYLKNAEGNVLSLYEDKDRIRVILDQTIFFPTGGGQSCDRGTLTVGEQSWDVIDVYEEGEEIIHVLQGAADGLAEGAHVSMEILWSHRFDNMQRHLGEHILSGAFYRLFGGHNKGFHMGEDYITIDIAFDEEADCHKVTWEMAMAAEADANRVITDNVPVHVDYFASRAETEKYPLRKPLAFDEDISIVTVGDPADPEDCVACCGTHPARTGEVGLLKIYKIEPNKGMSRIYFEAGGRALAHYRQQFDTLYELSTRLSAGTEDVLQKFEVFEQKAEKTHAELAALRSRLLEEEAERLASHMEPGLVAHYQEFSVDDLFNLGKKLAGRITGVIALVCEPVNTVVLLSGGTPACGALVKEHAAAFGGKGGGRPDSARAFFPDKDSMEDFLEKTLKQG